MLPSHSRIQPKQSAYTNKFGDIIYCIWQCMDTVVKLIIISMNTVTFSSVPDCTGQQCPIKHFLGSSLITELIYFKQYHKLQLNVEICILTGPHLGFSQGRVQTLQKEQTNVKRKRNEYNSYIGDNFLITKSYKIRCS